MTSRGGYYEVADGELVAIGEQAVELPAVGDEIRARIEYLGKMALHLDDVGADGDAAAAALLQALSAGEMVGMDVGLEDPGEAQRLLGEEAHHPLDAFIAGAAGARLVIEQGIDDGAIRPFPGIHHMTHRAGDAVMEGLDLRGHHALSL